ncbi:MAG: ABC transporter permease subunit [Xenophilus sp.]
MKLQVRGPRPRGAFLGFALSKKSLYGLLSWLMPLLVFLMWEAASQAGWIRKQVMPPPSAVLATAWKMTLTGELPRHLGASLLRAAGGFAIGGLLGFGLGILTGFSPLAHALLDRVVQMVRAIPFLALLPLVIVWFGVDEGGKLFLVSLAVFFPIYINTGLGIRQIDPKLLEVARVTRLSRVGTVRRIILPGALPSVLTGVRYSLATAWLALVIAETLATTSGIGFLNIDAREFLQTDIIVLTVIIYAAIGVLADAVAHALEHRFLAWHPNYAR